MLVKVEGPSQRHRSPSGPYSMERTVDPQGMDRYILVDVYHHDLRHVLLNVYLAVHVNLRLPPQVPLLPYESFSDKSVSGDWHGSMFTKRFGVWNGGMEGNGHELQYVTLLACLMLTVRLNVTVSTNSRLFKNLEDWEHESRVCNNSSNTIDSINDNQNSNGNTISDNNNEYQQ